MAYTIKIIAQLEDTETGKVLEQLEVQQKQMALPSTFDDFLNSKNLERDITKMEDIMQEMSHVLIQGPVSRNLRPAATLIKRIMVPVSLWICAHYSYLAHP